MNDNYTFTSKSILLLKDFIQVQTLSVFLTFNVQYINIVFLV